MTRRNKVTVTVKGKGNSGIFVGGNVGNAISGSSENEVKVSLEGENLRATVAGGDIVETALFELGEMLRVSLEKTSDKKNVAEITCQLDEQVKKPSEERDVTRIKRLLNDLVSYIGLVSFTAEQVEKSKGLFEKLVRFFGA